MMRIKTGRSVQVETVCDFSEAEQQIQKVNNLFLLNLLGSFLMGFVHLICLTSLLWLP